MTISFIRLPAALKQLAMSKTTLYLKISNGTFPPPVKFGPRFSAWPQYEVDEVVEALMRQASDDELRSLVSRLLELRNNPPKTEAVQAAAMAA